MVIGKGSVDTILKEEEIEGISSSRDCFSLSFTLADKFGDYGLISVLILRKEKPSLFIDTWIMSCRVLKRDVESFVLNNLVELAEKNGFDFLVGEYLPTRKNELVQDHYKDLGFVPENGRWKLDVRSYKNRTNFISRKEE